MRSMPSSCRAPVFRTAYRPTSKFDEDDRGRCRPGATCTRHFDLTPSRPRQRGAGRRGRAVEGDATFPSGAVGLPLGWMRCSRPSARRPGPLDAGARAGRHLREDRSHALTPGPAVAPVTPTFYPPGRVQARLYAPDPGVSPRRLLSAVGRAICAIPPDLRVAVRPFPQPTAVGSNPHHSADSSRHSRCRRTRTAAEEGRDDLCETFFGLNRVGGTLYDGTTRLHRSDGTPLASEEVR